ncbi:MAG: MgtC/SapB family protein [Acidimicrobiia bacterium]
MSTFALEDQAVLVLEVCLASLLGAVIGWERDRAGKSAGIRTHVIICAASAFAVGLGELALVVDGTGDRTRTLHGVLTGIGFVGAGMIWKADRREGPSGLTSAATVMLVAVIGAACGLGAPLAAVAVTLIALITLWGVAQMEPHRDHGANRPPPHGAGDSEDASVPR